ncbi:DNA (cytosine-5-)-methyltransferase [Corynebacterium tuberculostearicum]|uniref:Cytosine-specific methyltransferase n=1 Tax=Corynebacterium tuberculostearicum TaxID=38304 RepID=A0AAE4SZN1_9CORY|nr:DNA (cytosine-5-)-methyltransferase [Corynebacterium tuberculostearicum]MDV2420187.1 DNA (cytosine-5-)-methyltransferase [Corynebacterium tuberculostearicum]
MKIGSLFSGYGGLDLAVEAIFNAQPAWFCEFDKAPSKVLAHHWPDVPNHKDVTQINWKEVEPVDILTGGSPCQDLSHAGKRAGMTEGTRSNLWVNMREAIATLQPKYVVWENVLGALSAKATSDSDLESEEGLLANTGDGHLRALGRVLGDLTEIGYDARWTTLRASDIGAPHHRARIFLIAWPRVLNTGHDAGRTEHGKQHETPTSRFRKPGESSVPDPGHKPGWWRAANDHATTSTRANRECEQCRDGVGTSAYPVCGRQCERHGKPAQSKQSQPYPSEQTLPNPAGGGRDYGQATHHGEAHREVHTPHHHCDVVADTGSVRQSTTGGHAVTSASELTRADSSVSPLSNTSSIRQHGRGTAPEQAQGAHSATDRHSSGIEWGRYAPAVRRWERITRPAPAPTELNTRGKPRLNAEFAEWLMGLPAGWVTNPDIGLTRSQQLKALGNGVVPPQAAYALQHLLTP